MPDLFGFCNNYKTPNFLQEVPESYCEQSISNLQAAADTFLNPKTYTDFSVTAGSNPEKSDKKDLTVGNVSKYNQKTSEISKLDASSLTKPSVSGCSASNVVREVFYTVYYKPTSSGHFQIANVLIDLVLQDTLDIDPKVCAETNGKTARGLFTQKFGIIYRAANEVGSLTDTQIAASGILYRSGNPGYDDGMPVIVSQGLKED